MRKRYLARIAAVLLAAGMFLPQTAGDTMRWSAVYAAEVEVAGQNGEMSVYEVSTEEELNNQLAEIQNSSNKGEEEHPIDIKITSSFNVTSPIVIPAGTYIYLHGTEAFIGNNENTATTLKKSAGSVSAVLQVDGMLTLEMLRLDANTYGGDAVCVSESGNLTIGIGTVLQRGCLTNKGTAVMNAGMITNSTYGGVCNAGEFTMSGGTITDNSKTQSRNVGYGGGVCNEAGARFYMNNSGKIYKNTANKGGGVYNAGNMEFSGGSIYGNSAVLSTNISNNASSAVGGYGGGIYNAGTFTFSGGTIGQKGNANSAGQGGGVWTSGIFNMESESAVISYNLASSNCVGKNIGCGGGVYVADGKFTLQNGKIESNQAVSTGERTFQDDDMKVYYFDGITESGGGVFVANTGTENGAAFEMQGGRIADNSAGGSIYGKEGYSNNGGGVYVQGGENEYVSTLPEAGENQEEQRTAKVLNAIPANFTMLGGVITGNMATAEGNGVYIGSSDSFGWVLIDGTESNGRVENRIPAEFAGSAAFLFGGSAEIYGNGTTEDSDDLYLSSDSQSSKTWIQVAKALEPVENPMKIVVEDTNENAVLAKYPESVSYQDSDLERFALLDVRVMEYNGDTRSILLKKRSLEECSISFVNPDETFTYDGQPKEPEVVLHDEKNDRDLKADTYDVEYKNNTNAGTATIIVTPTSESGFTGSLATTFEIAPRSLSKASAALNSLTQGTYRALYTGTAVKPSATLIVLNDTELNMRLLQGQQYTMDYKNNTDANHTNQMEWVASVVITGKGNYEGTLEYNFTIYKTDISKLKVSAVSDYAYTGAAIKPNVTVTDGSATLRKGTDYTLSYGENTKIGTASVTITGTGKYAGTKTISFKILPKSISKASIRNIANQVYTGRAISPKLTVKLGTVTLRSGTDYTLTYSSNKNAGKAKVTITGTGIYSGTRTVTFNIVPKKTTLKSAKSKKKQQLTVTWKKNTQASGYQIMIARNAKFTSSKKTKTITGKTKTSYTFSKLKKGKKYYVAVRAYKTIDKKKVYGAWSNYRTAVVKKK